MRMSAFGAAAIFGLLSLAGTSLARTFANTNAAISIPSPAVWYIGKFCFNPVQGGQIQINAQGSSSTYLVFLDDDPNAWPRIQQAAGDARAGNVYSYDPKICQSFLDGSSTPSEYNGTLPVTTTIGINENFRRNWYFAFVNCAPQNTDTLSVTSYSIVLNQGQGGTGSPLSCEETGKYELFATYMSFSLIAIFALCIFAKKLNIPIFSPSAPHAQILYALMVFFFGLIFVLADADSQRATGNMVPQIRQNFGMFFLQVADWMMLTHAFALCTGIATFGHLKEETNIVKGILAAFCLTYFILSIATIATDGATYDMSFYEDAQPVNASGVGISVLRFLLWLYLGYMAFKSYQAETALENKSFLKTFYAATLSWQFIICVCIMATINGNPVTQMITVWASTLTFNFCYLVGVCFLLMSRWTDVPTGSGSARTGKKQPFIDDDVTAAANSGTAGTAYAASGM